LKNICFVVSSPLTANAFLADHITALSRRYSIDLVCNVTEPSELGRIASHAKITRIRIFRNVSPIEDFVACLRLYALFRQERYAAVSSVTPKAGILTMLAAAAAGISLRTHIFTGQVWATRTGWKRQLLKMADRLIARLATHILADSPSQRDFMVAEGIAPAQKIRVLGKGAICGVDGDRFRPDAGRRAQIRKNHAIPEGAFVYLFLGRITRDKGVLDLADAFASIANPIVWLLVVGPDETNLKEEMKIRLGEALMRTCFVDCTARPEDYMAAADVVCLPSCREGFGMVIIEAAATGIPAVASRIYGITDAVEENTTGMLHESGSVAEISSLMAEMARNQNLRLTMGQAARERALQLFSIQNVTGNWLNFYGELLG
jgi:glycosyltransferase involved in cell wall biosynthesis